LEKESKDPQKETYKREIDKKEGVKLVTEKTGNRTNITGGANKFQRDIETKGVMVRTPNIRKREERTDTLLQE